MDMARGGEYPLFGDIAPADRPGVSETAPTTNAIQDPIAQPFAAWTHHLPLREHAAGVIAGGQTGAEEVANAARRFRVAITSGTAAVRGYGQSVATATARAFNNTGSRIRHAPEAIAYGLCLAAMGGLAFMGATDWDTRRDQLERYTASGEEVYSPSTAPAPSIDWQPARSSASSYYPLSSATSPAHYQLDRYAGDAPSDMPAWLLPLYHQEVATTRAKVTQGQADLATRYLTQFMRADAGRYQAPPPPPTAPSGTRAVAARERRPTPAYRRIRVRIGAMTMAFAGPTSGIYDQIGAWRAQNPGSVILSDEPVLV